MLLSTALVPLGAAIVLAAPVLPDFNAEAPGSLQCVSDYFNLLAEKVQNLRFMSAEPVCDLSKAVLPEGMQSTAQ